MKEYIERLMACGYSEEKARQICIDFSNNLHLFDLDYFVESIEKVNERKCGLNTIQIQLEETLETVQ